jgi:Ca-activated chloride channel homolog
MRVVQPQMGVMLFVGLSLLGANDRKISAAAAGAHFRADSHLVLVPVSVTDPLDHPVMGLDLRHFRVYERGVEQRVIQCSREDMPMAIGLVFDTSLSMAPKLGAARAAAAALLRTANPEDEFFLIEFQDRPRVTQAATSDPRDIEARLAQATAQGHTSLLDATYLGVEKLLKSTRPRKALVILSDGGDNHSRYTVAEVRSRLRESDIAVYAMGLFAAAPAIVAEEERDGPSLLADMARQTGGRFVPVTDLKRLAEAAGAIGAELHNRYVIGYAPGELEANGKYRSVQVKVVPPEGLRAVRVSWRPGYYAPIP